MMPPDIGLDVGGRIIVLDDLQADLVAGGVPVPYGLSIVGPPASHSFPPPIGLQPLPYGSKVFTYTDQGQPTNLPPEANAIVAAYTYTP